MIKEIVYKGRTFKCNVTIDKLMVFLISISSIIGPIYFVMIGHIDIAFLLMITSIIGIIVSKGSIFFKYDFIGEVL